MKKVTPTVFPDIDNFLLSFNVSLIVLITFWPTSTCHRMRLSGSTLAKSLDFLLSSLRSERSLSVPAVTLKAVVLPLAIHQRVMADVPVSSTVDII
jgi:hypothetical protein